MKEEDSDIYWPKETDRSKFINLLSFVPSHPLSYVPLSSPPLTEPDINVHRLVDRYILV